LRHRIQKGCGEAENRGRAKLAMKPLTLQVVATCE